ncbi:aminotransferase class I and II [Tibeticola sediminis]|uniref:Aminotransferase n=1 Tax=Tibeticola sediminis TaxID=1917811 RepID=A0A3N4UVQ0_9BURK|nr:aminotransferase class I/II-fold pyridoxal phosphate-dependent enzyme [Tibeticola sediminis]RPE72865.1 aminotransferase class I and II [Tibeticola sediminis]
MRAAVRELSPSLIREVANAGIGRSDVLPFWFGESDEVTPAFIREAAIASLQAGETFYAHNLGLPELREAVARYISDWHPAIGVDRIAITAGGVNGLMIAMQALVDPGDEVVVVTPVWPNLTAQPHILSARLRCVPLRPAGSPGGEWSLDLEVLLAAITPQTRLLVVVQSFSKSFLMTGWRLGWLVMPASLTEHVGKLIEFNTSCNSVFTQRAAITALERTDELTPRLVRHLRSGRDRLVSALARLPRLQVSVPRGGMYAFFRLEGYEDSLILAKRLAAEAGLGLAPGAAFGPEARSWLRWCFASRDLDRLDRGVERLDAWLAAQSGNPRAL